MTQKQEIHKENTVSEEVEYFILKKFTNLLCNAVACPHLVRSGMGTA